MNVPRSGVAMMSPNGLTRFCLGIADPLLLDDMACTPQGLHSHLQALSLHSR